MMALAVHAGLAASAHAQNAARTNFDIPPQPLSSGIVLFSRQSGISVITPAGLVRDKKAPAVRGYNTPGNALTALLAGTPKSRCQARQLQHLYHRAAGPRKTLHQAGSGFGSCFRANGARSRSSGTLRLHRQAPAQARIVVTGSRIAVSDYQQPTPVIVVGEDVIQRDAKPPLDRRHDPGTAGRRPLRLAEQQRRPRAGSWRERRGSTPSICASSASCARWRCCSRRAACRPVQHHGPSRYRHHPHRARRTDRRGDGGRIGGLGVRCRRGRG